MPAARGAVQRTLIGKPDPARTIYAISPSGAVEDPDAIRHAVEHLGRAGFAVQLDRSALRRYQRFAGTDAQRAGGFARALASDASIVMATRGGYGLTRYLATLDFRALARSGKRFVGLSDFTAFHLAMLATQKAVTWAGPCLGSSFGTERFTDIDPTTLETFVDAMDGTIEVLGFDCKGPSGLEAEGVLWGGNLTMVCAMLGTPWFPKVSGGILFLEDVNEHPYRIERMLTQLLHAGVLARQKAIVFGTFSGIRPVPNDRGFDLAAVYRWLRRQVRTPIVTGLRFGHEQPCLTLPHGARVGLAVEKRTCWLVLPHRH
ncbi:MAG: LD-carboxypeptidase [Lautropia sp.]